jgi:hypothetical protein
MNALTANDITRVEAKVDALAAKVDDLLLAWNTARGVVKFVKYLSATVTAVSAAIAAVWAVLHLGGAK